MGENQLHRILFCCCFLRSLSGSVRCFFSFSHFVCFMKLMLENRTQLVGILYLFIYCCCSSNRKRVRRTWVANVYVLCACVCVHWHVCQEPWLMNVDYSVDECAWGMHVSESVSSDSVCVYMGAGLKLSSAESIPAQRVSTCIRLI